MASNNGGLDASIWGISDTELLAIVDDLADENGWTTTLAVRLQLGEDPEAVGHRTGIGGRLAWMVRYGWLERHADRKRSDWRLTAMGHAMLDNPDLSRAVESALAKLNPAQRIRLAREIGEAGSGQPRKFAPRFAGNGSGRWGGGADERLGCGANGSCRQRKLRLALMKEHGFNGEEARHGVRRGIEGFDPLGARGSHHLYRYAPKRKRKDPS